MTKKFVKREPVKTVQYPANRHGRVIGQIRKDTYELDPSNALDALAGNIWYTAIFPDGTAKEAGNSATNARDLLVEQDKAVND